jgi:two-component system, LytTR family, sensor kinase
MAGTPLFLTIGLLFFAVAAFSLFYQKQKIKAQKKEIESINQELEKRLLRAQINPHFLFNSLSSIQHFITENDKVSALKYLSKFSILLRQMLEQSTHIHVVLAEEIKLLNNYLDLEALRFDGQFSFSVEADPEVDIHTTEVPILLVQPYVENAILHALSPKKGRGHLLVRFSDAGAYTVCTIRDNGIGRRAAEALKAAHHPSRPSRGMAITEKRLAVLYQDEAKAIPVQIKDLLDEKGDAAGTEVIVHIPKSLK